MKRILAFTAFLLLLSFTAAQKLSQTYETENFKIQYPDFWKATNDEGIINLFPENQIGAVTISGYDTIDFPLEETPKFILDMYSSEDSASKVQSKTSGGVSTYYYEYTDDQKKELWMTKVIRKGKLFYILTINIPVKYWSGNYKNDFQETFNSFKLKK